jgi:hypothetical protein
LTAVRLPDGRAPVVSGSKDGVRRWDAVTGQVRDENGELACLMFTACDL